jgi:radical SAM superfamily enzyme YgiQ (UPF0313 family)
MVWKTDKSHRKFAESEIGAIRKDWKGRIRVALVYPNRYYVGMSNLGFQTVYHLLNQIDHVLCERSFLPEKNGHATDRITTIESGRPISDFDIIAFSLSFENDYLNLLTILETAGIPLQSSSRKDIHPLIIAGGVACFLNPEPIALFIDCFLIGEAETMLPRFLEVFLPALLKTDKKSHLKDLAGNVPGVYVPCLYKTTYNRDGTIRSFEPTCDVPEKIKRIVIEDISHIPTCSAILTPFTTFQRTFLIEVSRGCPHGCRFCGAGYIYNIRISFSSLRADAMTPELISALRQSKVKTATIAPDAGSERMRRVINKNITEEDILEATETLVLNGIPNLKLYFLIGLPTETADDVEEIIKLCIKIKQRFLKSSRIKKHIGQITVSLNPFVPKPFTPFQWVAMDDERTLKKKIKRVKDGLKKIANIRVHADTPRHAYIQALFSRGDRKAAQILSLAHYNHGNWAKTLKSKDLNPDFYALRDRALDELLPWDFIDHGIRKTYLKREYKRALQGKTSEPCNVESCTICGVCKKK